MKRRPLQKKNTVAGKTPNPNSLGNNPFFFILLKSFFRINDNSVLKQRKREKERERKRDTLLFFHGSERGNKGGLMDIEVKNPAMTIVEVFTLLAGEQISCLRSQNWP